MPTGKWRERSRIEWLKERRRRDVVKTQETLTSRLERVKAMAPHLPEALASRLVAKNMPVRDIIERIGQLGPKQRAIVHGLENRLAQFTTEERELAALVKQYGLKKPNELPPGEWERILTLTRIVYPPGKNH